MTAVDTTTTPRLPEIERWLDEHGIAWRIKDVPLDDIDQVAGLANQTRLDALNADAVDRYTADMQAGAVFPPAIVRRDGERFLPVDGNHRITASRNAGRAAVAAYVLDDITTDVAHLLAIAANRTHGLPLTDEERLWHAVNMTKAGSQVKTAAATCGIPVSRLQLHLQAERFAARCTKRNLTGWAHLNNTVRARLDSVEDDKVFDRLVDLAGARSLQNRELDDTITRVKQLNRDEALTFLADVKRDNKGRTPAGRGHPPDVGNQPRRRLLLDLDLLISRYTPDQIAADCTTNASREQLSDQIKATARHLMKIERRISDERSR